MGRAPEGLCRPQGERGGNRRGDHRLRQGAHRPLQGPGRRRVRRRAPQDLDRQDPEVPAARAGVGGSGTARRLAPPGTQTTCQEVLNFTERPPPSGFLRSSGRTGRRVPALWEAWGRVVRVAKLTVDVEDHVKPHVETGEDAELEGSDREPDSLFKQQVYLLLARVPTPRTPKLRVPGALIRGRPCEIVRRRGGSRY